MKKWSVWLTCILVAVLMVAGLGAIAAEYGSQSDPLVTLSYIQQVLLPQAKEDIDEQVKDSLSDFEEVLEEENSSIRSYIDRKMRSFASGKVDDDLVEEIAQAVVALEDGQVSAQNSTWTTITVPAGTSVICSSGFQAVLRSGQAVAIADASGGLLDLSNGVSLLNGLSVELNHLYTSGSQGNGLYAVQDCTLMISGSYTTY